MKIKQKFNQLLLPLLLLAVAIFSQAALAACAGHAHCYQVEIIVFQNTSAKALQSETWASPQQMPNTTNAINLSYTNNQSAYRLLPRSSFNMAQQAAALRRKANYRILSHIAWEQPLPDPHNAHSVLISAGSNNGWNLNGIITLSRVGLINVASNLILNMPVSELSSTEQNTTFANRGFASFQLRQHQRMRVNEIHYFDHPLFGMLVEVTRR